LSQDPHAPTNLDALASSQHVVPVERLQKTQARAPESLPDFPQYSIEEMDNMKVDFRVKHLGRQFLQRSALDHVVSEAPWIKSQDVPSSHDYIERKIERAELEGRQILVKESMTVAKEVPSSASGKLFKMAKAKAKAAPMPISEMPVEHPELQGWNMDDVELIGRWACRPRTNTSRCARAHWSQQSMPSSSTSSRFQVPAHLNAESGGSQ